MSAFALISSGFPPRTDFLGSAAEGPFVNIPLEFGREKLK
jgi:hypothetical protein